MEDSKLSFQEETAHERDSEPEFQNPTLPITPVPPGTGACPKCGNKLTDPLGLGWCQKCGYCRSLEEDKTQALIQRREAQKRQPSPLGSLEFFQMVARFPAWTWVLIGGVAMVVALNVPPALSLPDDCLGRALWSSIEICLGFALIIGAQTWALCLLAPNDDRLGFKDAIIPGRLWALVAKNLPAMREQLWMASWGLAAILSGLIVVGGLGHWFTYLPRQEPPPRLVMPAIEVPSIEAK